MQTAPTLAATARRVLRPALHLCAPSLVAAVLAAQCIETTQVPDGTISSGAICYSNNNTLTAGSVIINGSASVGFIAGQNVHLTPGFHATGGTADTTFHAWVETAPSAVSVVPSWGSGISQQFTWTVSSPAGHSNIAHVYALFHTSPSGAYGCYIYYSRGANSLFLANDAGTAWTGGFYPGTSSSVSNSYCTIYGAGSSVSASGNQLALTVNVTFQASTFLGAKNSYLNVYNTEGLYSGLQQMGTWTVPSGTGFTPIRISTGGPYIDSLGQYWAADYGYLESLGTWSTNAAISGTADPQLYRTERYNYPGSLTYQFAVPNGNYTVTLKFAEIYNTGPGQRYQNIALNGATVVTGLDVWTAAGGPNRAYDVSFPVTVTSGQLTISLTCTSPNNSAEVNSIQIVAASAPQQYYLTTAVSPPGGGSISPASGWYGSGAQVWVAATPASGYTFTGFSGDLTGSTNPQPLTMNGNKSVTANYQPAAGPDFSLLSRTGSQILAAGRNGQYTISVQPINGFSGTVYFSASGLPSGAAALFNPPSIAGAGSTTMTVSTTSASVTNNPITITVTGTSGSLNRSVMPYLTVNPPGSSIHPAALEVNLSAVPIDRYWLTNDDGSGTPIISHCPVTYTVRQCIAKLFNNDPGNPIAQGPNGVQVEWNNWIAQGVTGVRFFFGVAGGFWSTPYIPNSPLPGYPFYTATHPTIQSGTQPEAAWASNLNAFFQDLRAYGVQTVTPTPALDSWGWNHGKIDGGDLAVCGGAEAKKLFFLPFLPFALDPEDSYFPVRHCGDQSYQNGQTPATPDHIFWGWDRFFNLMATVISSAASNQLAVNTLDYYQETNMADFTVQARMIYDNTRNVDVVAGLQDRLGWYHDYVFSGIDPLGASPSANRPTVPSPVTENCVSSHYGDSGQLPTLSALTAALKGNKAIGALGLDPQTGLYCGPLLSGGTDVPIGRRVFPSFIDIHTQTTFGSTSDMAAWSKNFHSRIYEFVSANGLSGRRVVFGETNPVDPPSCNDPWTKEQAEAMLYGISGLANGFVNSGLFLNYAGNVVMRPWQDISQSHSSCMAFPNTINPPFNPRQ